MTLEKRGEFVAVSTCLLGVHCRYDGGTKRDDALLERLKDACVIPICPEMLGGLPTPRPAAHFEGGDGRAVLEGRARLVNEKGADVTEAFLLGARLALRICTLLGVARVYFKDKSPACGATLVTIDGTRVEGKGVATAMLEREGIEVVAVP